MLNKSRKMKLEGVSQMSHSVGQSDISKLLFCIVGVMSTLLVYGVLQERIMKSPYGAEKEYLKHSLFIVLCNRVLTCSIAALFMLISRKDITPVAPVFKYGVVSLSNVLATTCQYEALKHVSFPVQTLGKCAKMLPVMMWGTFILKRRYGRKDYLVAGTVTMGCAAFFLTEASTPFMKQTDSNLLGIILMMGYLGFDGFTSTFQDKLFKGYSMDIYNQVLYTTLCSGLLSFFGLLIQGHLSPAFNFVVHHPECLYDIVLLSCAATASQFFISYTIRKFGALIFATLMTTRQLFSIILSCIFFNHPLAVQQWGAAIVVFMALYSNSYLSSFKKGDKIESIQLGSVDLEQEQFLVGPMDTRREKKVDINDIEGQVQQPI